LASEGYPLLKSNISPTLASTSHFPPMLLVPDPGIPLTF
jgi:hypothetical protein